MRYGSVCSGIEAASVAWAPLGWTPAFFSEIERFPCEVLAERHGSNLPGEPLSRNAPPNLGDMTKFQEWPDADIDVLVGGTPCQSFSVAGLRKGIADPRGNLALTYLGIVDRYRPTWVVWENVPGVLSSATHDAPDQRPPSIDLDGGNGPRDGEEVVVTDEYDADETHALACFLSGLQELGYGLTYRVLDAQFVTVDGYEWAVPQRRERVFVVGYLGDWRRAAAVFLEFESLRGDPAPRRKAGERVASTIAGGARGRGGYSTDDIPLVSQTLSAARGAASAHAADLETYLPVAFGGGNRSGPIDAAACLTAKGQRIDFEVETFVAHSLRGEGFDASEDGTGRGTPIVPVHTRDVAATLTRGADSQGKGGYAGRRQEDESNLVAHPYTLAIRGRGDTHNLEYRQDGTSNAILTPNGGRAGIGVGAIAFDTKQITSKANRSVPKPGDPCHPLAAGAHAPAIAIQAGALRENPSSGPDGVGVQEGISYTLEARAEVQAVASGWAVRRLTPLECERLQGFPDGYTAISRTTGKPAADGPRYKALGNSMAVNVMRWIGRRIEMVDALDREIKREEAA